MLIGLIVISSSLLLTSAAPSLIARNLDEDEQAWILEEQNKIRLSYAAPPLQWSEVLATGAQKRAEVCSFGRLSALDEDVGQNIGWVPVIDTSGPQIETRRAALDSIINNQWNEPAKYDFRNPAKGPFAQLVWKATEYVGCGMEYCTDIERWQLVCRYWPEGNTGGTKEFQGNVGPPKIDLVSSDDDTSDTDDFRALLQNPNAADEVDLFKPE